MKSSGKFLLQNPASTALGSILLPAEQQEALLTNKKATYEAILALINNSSHADELRQSLAVRLANETKAAQEGGMYGFRVRDTIGAQKTHLDMSPYTRTGAVAHAVVTNTDPETGKIYVLLVQGKDVPKDASAKGILKIPGGYMQSAPPTGAEEGEKQIFDLDLEHAARRELKEETRLSIPDGQTGDFLGFNSRHGVSNVKALHTVNGFYHYRLNVPVKALPAVKGGTDVDEARWVDVERIRPNHSAGQTAYSIQDARGNRWEVWDLHAEHLDTAVRNIYLEPGKHRMQALGVEIDSPPPALGPEGKKAYARLIANLTQLPSGEKSSISPPL